ncbi:MAG: hypothetical protein EOP11_10920 [Proteobacteria bacterium]|nr:MAG: hypothetical protein EOP11_10920 [Pseudomonadota bacterium]
MNLFILAFFCMFPLITPAKASGECPVVLEKRGIRLTECNRLGGQASVHLRLGEDLGFSVRAEFDPALNEKMFYRLGALGASRPLKASDQEFLRASVLSFGAENFSAASRALLDFVGLFAEPGFQPREKDLSREAYRRQKAAGGLLATTTILCHKLGRPHTGYFTARGESWQQTMVIGSHECTGKCGKGCGLDGDWRQGQYTQECFDHDLCCTMTKENMGDCEDEFWAAASGFLTAPLCMFKEVYPEG